MSKMKEIMMDPLNHPDKVKRIYISKGEVVDRETFIKEISLVLYDGLYDTDTVFKALFSHMEFASDEAEDIVTMRSIIDEMIHGSNQGAVEIADEIYSSYFELVEQEEETEECQGTEERPMKKFDVSYDILVKPALQLPGQRPMWRRVEIIMEATSYGECRRKFREQFERLNPGRKMKRIDIVLHVPEEVTETVSDADGEEA